MTLSFDNFSLMPQAWTSLTFQANEIMTFSTAFLVEDHLHESLIIGSRFYNLGNWVSSCSKRIPRLLAA